METYPSYLVHFNRQHDPKTGKFTYGDGDGDGISNDHKNQNKSSLDTSARRAETYTARPLSDGRSRFSRSSSRGITYAVKPNNTSGQSHLDRSARRSEIYRPRDNRTIMTTSSEKDRDEIVPKSQIPNNTSGKSHLDRSARRSEIYRPRDNRTIMTTSSEKDRDEIVPKSQMMYRPVLTREGTGQLVRLGDTKVPNLVKGDRRENPKGGNKISETIGNMNATLSRNFTRTNEKEHLYGPGGYDYNAPPSNGSTKYDAEQRNNSNTLNDADYYLRNNKLTNPIEDGKKLIDSAKDREVDEQKVTNREATEIFVMRALGQTLYSLYIDDPDERREKNKELLERTNTKNWYK